MVRTFLPGSEWLYLKIYSGNKTCDTILQQAISPVLHQLFKEKLISKWFFVRYNDPKSHLRLRLQLIETKNYNNVLNKVTKSLDTFLNSGEISKITNDSYNRELERYGATTIEYAEYLFYRSSGLVLNFLDYDDEEKIIVSMFYFDQLLSKISLSDTEKLIWATNLDGKFKKEFNSDKKLNSQLDKKFRMFKSEYMSFLKNIEFLEIRDLINSNISRSFDSFEDKINLSVGNLSSVSLVDFFQSIFHMHINRTFISDQRLFEMIINDYLCRYYKIAFYKYSYS